MEKDDVGWWCEWYTTLFDSVCTIHSQPCIDFMLEIAQNEGAAVSEPRELTAEEISFLEAHGVRLQKKLKKRIESMSTSAYATYKMTVVISRCLREMDLETATKVYREAKRNRVNITQDSMHKCEHCRTY